MARRLNERTPDSGSVREAADVEQVPERRAEPAALLRLTALLMEASFQVLGEGAILGSLPATLERFGRANARHIQGRFLETDAEAGPEAALAPLRFVSDVTGTPFEMPRSDGRRAVKRLAACEFQNAFADQAPFPRAMACMLHRAAYEGSVNALVEDREEGYEVRLESRILFGDPHCDFVVESRRPRPGGVPVQTLAAPGPEELAPLRRAFYEAMVNALLVYLAQMLPEPHVDRIVDRCTARLADEGLGRFEGVRVPAAAPGARYHVVQVTGGR